MRRGWLQRDAALGDLGSDDIECRPRANDQQEGQDDEDPRMAAEKSEEATHGGNHGVGRLIAAGLGPANGTFFTTLPPSED